MEKQFDFEKAKRRYNKLMFTLCMSYLTIGTRYSMGTDDWNIRDMVSECAYQYCRYFNRDTIMGGLRYGNEAERKIWRSETGILKRFIYRYENDICGIVCADKHRSAYDN